MVDAHAGGAAVSAGALTPTRPTADGEEAVCGGCKKSIVEEEGSMVISFGSALFHLDCFRCAKCHSQVQADTNLLILSDGQPVCESCSYLCVVCKQPILDEAIMTGDDSYHAACFTCISCGCRIDELVFARTSKGIFCMPCHNRRVEKSRRAAQAGGRRRVKEQSSTGNPSSSRSPRPPTSPQPLSSSAPSASASSSRPTNPHIFPTPTPSPHTTPTRTPAAYPFPSSAPSSSSLATTISDAGASDRTRKPSATAQESLSLPNIERAGGAGSESNNGSRRSSSMDGLGLGLEISPTTLAQRRRSGLPPSLAIAGTGGVGSAFSSPSSASTPSDARPQASPRRTNFPLSSSTDGLGAPTSDLPVVRPLSPRRAKSPLPPERSPSPSPSPVRPTSPLRFETSSSVPKNTSLALPNPLSPPLSPSRAAPTAPPAEETPRFSLYDPDFLALLDTGLGGDFSVFGEAEVEEARNKTAPQSERKGLSRSPLMDLAAAAASEDDTTTPSPSCPSTPTKRVRPRGGSAASTTAEEGAAAALAALVREAKGPGPVSVEQGTLELILRELGEGRERIRELGSKYTEMKTTSIHVFQGLTGVKEEYDSEASRRRDAEAEIARLRVQLSEHAGRLARMQHERKGRESKDRLSQDVKSGLVGMQNELARLRAERDVVLAELEELGKAAKRPDTLGENTLRRNREVPPAAASSGTGTGGLDRALSVRLEGLKSRYKDELPPLTRERDALKQEIAELKEMRDVFLEETAALNVRNEELAELNNQVQRQLEAAQQELAALKLQQRALVDRAPAPAPKQKHHHHQHASPSLSSIATSENGTPHQQHAQQQQQQQQQSADEARVVKVGAKLEQAQPVRKFRWLGAGKGAAPAPAHANGTGTGGAPAPVEKPLPVPGGGGSDCLAPPAPPAPVEKGGRPSRDVSVREHLFQPMSLLRIVRCDHCGDKMWGRQEMRCAICGMYCHAKCCTHVRTVCSASTSRAEEEPAGSPRPSMFGRDLTEHLREDGRAIPIVVEKCVAAVEDHGMDYEGVYRKSGGAAMCKEITAQFERRRYDAFDLCDQDRFNDISAITSVLKNYFRGLPNPLLTHALHESFVAAAQFQDPEAKQTTLARLVHELPRPHFDTLAFLMLHLHRVTRQASVNLMTARNMGVVFGPTLMRSKDPAREFADVAGKALTVEWLVDNAAKVFAN